MNCLLILCILILLARSNQLQLKSIRSCDQASKSSVEANVASNNYLKYLNLNLTTPLGNDPIELVINASTDNRNFRNLATIRQQNSCMALNKAIAGIWYDLQRALRIPQPGICPIAKGSYSVSNYQLDMSKLSLPDFPRAFLRVILRLFSMPTNGTMVCLMIEFDNR